MGLIMPNVSGTYLMFAFWKLTKDCSKLSRAYVC
jgi:hypothetical protein